ncbi:MAG: adenylosuccinate lyase, partial [Candidatus Altarchaeaceae archaeon]
WHERDLTNSSAERIIIPEICILTDYILNLAIDLIKNLEFNYENIKRNLNNSKVVLAERVMVELTKRGMPRQEAHELIRRIAMESYNKKEDFEKILIKHKEVTKFLNEKEISEILKPENYIGKAVEKVNEICENLKIYLRNLK